MHITHKDLDHLKTLIDSIIKAETEDIVLPLPIKRDDFGRSTKNYSSRDWFGVLNQMLGGIMIVCTSSRADEMPALEKKLTAMHLTDLIVLCTSFMDWLGYDQQARAELQRLINDSNRSLGSLEDDDDD